MGQRVCFVGSKLVFEFLQNEIVGFTPVFCWKNKRMSKMDEQFVNHWNRENTLNILLG
jgi:hypothetical protein